MFVGPEGHDAGVADWHVSDAHDPSRGGSVGGRACRRQGIVSAEAGHDVAARGDRVGVAWGQAVWGLIPKNGWPRYQEAR